MSDSTKMLTALVRLRGALQDARLPLEVPDVETQRESLSEMVDQLEDYVIPRLMTIDAPLLTVVGGSTGAGKSTLVARWSAPGSPSPVCSGRPPVHPCSCTTPRTPSGSARTGSCPTSSGRRTPPPTRPPSSSSLRPRCPRAWPSSTPPTSTRVEERNRTLAAQLLAAADLWLFVTSAARYADQVPWDFLKKAAERSTAVAIVLDRTPVDAVETVSTHLARMLASRGLKDSPLFVVTEGTVDETGLLPAEEVADIRGWLEALASDADARAAVVKQTLDGAVRTVSRHSYTVADAIDVQVEAVTRLRQDAERAYDESLKAIQKAAGGRHAAAW